MGKLSEIKKWIADQKEQGILVTLGSVAGEIRERWCPHRRFSDPVYYSHSGGTVKEWADAFYEELIDESTIDMYTPSTASVTWCARWPITKTAYNWAAEVQVFWSEELEL
jgi:hypothetical protein